MIKKKIKLLLDFFNDFQNIIDKKEMSDLMLICAEKVKEIEL